MLFRNFDIRGAADRTLIYLTLHVVQCLVKLERIEDKPSGTLHLMNTKNSVIIILSWYQPFVSFVLSLLDHSLALVSQVGLLVQCFLLRRISLKEVCSKYTLETKRKKKKTISIIYFMCGRSFQILFQTSKRRVMRTTLRASFRSRWYKEQVVASKFPSVDE